ncbi:MAG: hypothetical protein SWX82_13350 [Cyanobacteriota bacterium]|nr:hypothetical protein [Cyanobacteriota bacterium]
MVKQAVSSQQLAVSFSVPNAAQTAIGRFFLRHPSLQSIPEQKEISTPQLSDLSEVISYQIR